MKEIPLSQGKVALVDDEDYERVSAFRWAAAHSSGRLWYATRTDWRAGRTVRMHRFILSLGPGDRTLVDHINGNGLDNRRENLRLASGEQNHHNRRKLNSGSSRFKGVNRHRHHGRMRWRAAIRVANKWLWIGHYDVEEDAARAYDEAARKYHGEFACVNFPRPGEHGALAA